MTTYVPKQREIDSAWWVVDAAGLTLGRLASAVASRIRGKHKATYTPYLDTGDHVIVVNAEKAVLTGDKLQSKFYRHHTLYPGGLKEERADKLLRRRPERLIETAVQGMLPKGRLGRKLHRKLKVYVGPHHPHAAQQPQSWTIAGAARAQR